MWTAEANAYVQIIAIHVLPGIVDGCDPVFWHLLTIKCGYASLENRPSSRATRMLLDPNLST
jgi:hypothetical protein